MYSFNTLNRVLQDPVLALREVNRLYYQRLNHRQFNASGIDIIKADWDNLILLDACRHDILSEEIFNCRIESFETRRSRGAATPEFLRANFSDREMHDVVYVTANSWIFRIGDEIGADFHAVYQAKDDTDPKQRKTTDMALEAAENHPDKRLIIHYIPPHHPFIGNTADRVFEDLEEQPSDLFDQIRRNDIDLSNDTLWKMYLENLERVIPQVEELLNTLDGKTVISADHGELLGDRCAPIPHKGYGHVSGLYVNELVRVPWLVSINGERKDVQKDEPLHDVIDSRSNEEINEHLRALGYKV